MTNAMDGTEGPSRCMRLLYALWKFCTFVFSHVTLVSLVVAYCVLGAFAFESLEAEHEREVKRSIKSIRGNVTEDLWEFTQNADVLIQENWTMDVTKKLKAFETDLLRKMKKEGWDGSEAEENIQWTFAGALFYSIIVITTIGYGHIAPKTQSGKVVTIFYAILGIPLMLLCLSNIGDIMASSFRFLYWKVCCYACTRPPKRRRGRNVRATSVRQSGRYLNRTASFRRSVRASQRSADSALGLSDSMIRSSYSDTECRYHLDGTDIQRAPDARTVRQSTVSRYSDVPAVASPRTKGNRTTTGTASLDRRFPLGPGEANRFPVLFNRYALDPEDESPTRRWSANVGRVCRNRELESNVPGRIVVEVDSGRACTRSLPRHLSSSSSSAERTSAANHRQRQRSQPPPEIRVPNDPNDPLGRTTVDGPRRAQSYYGGRSTRSQDAPARSHGRREVPSPRIMSPMGFAIHRQIYVDDLEVDYAYGCSKEHDRTMTQRIKPVPIWLCVFLVVSYIFGGAFLFSKWENWVFLDSAYFCFITLTTIGFGDFVPAHRLHAEKSIALCSLYLLFGIALLAMSFNLVQEEVINNVKTVAKRLGIIKEEEEDEDDDDDDDDDGDDGDGDDDGYDDYDD